MIDYYLFRSQSFHKAHSLRSTQGLSTISIFGNKSVTMNKEHGFRVYNPNPVNKETRKREMFQRIDEKDGIKGESLSIVRDRSNLEILPLEVYLPGFVTLCCKL